MKSRILITLILVAVLLSRWLSACKPAEPETIKIGNLVALTGPRATRVQPENNALNPCLLLLDQPAAGMNPKEPLELVDLTARIPKLLLLDEPSLGLAPVLVNQMFDSIQQIARQGTTILLVEQNALQSLKIANRAYVLEVGHIVREGTGQELLRDPSVQAAYLGVRQNKEEVLQDASAPPAA